MVTFYLQNMVRNGNWYISITIILGVLSSFVFVELADKIVVLGFILTSSGMDVLSNKAKVFSFVTVEMCYLQIVNRYFIRWA